MHRNLRPSLEEPLEALVPGAVLRGTLTLPSGSGRVPAMVVAHGASFGLRRAPIYDEVVDVLLGVGIAVLRYDRRGEGESTGSAESVTLEELADDLVACVRLLHEHPRVQADRVGVWGFSQGGWVVALAAAAEPSIAGLVAVSASGTGPAEQMEYAVETTMRASGYGDHDVEAALSARRMVCTWEDGLCETPEVQALFDSINHEPWFPMAYLGDLSEDLRTVDRHWSHFDVRPALERIRVPVLLFFGDRDRWVDPVRSPEIWKATLTHADVTAVPLSGAGHMPTLALDPDSLDAEESGPTHPEYIAQLRNWSLSVLRPGSH